MNQMQYPIQNILYNHSSSHNLNSSKYKIFIENLDWVIAEDYLYKRFKEDCRQITGIKINKEKNTLKSKGTAVITFAHPDFAEEARKKFNQDDALYAYNECNLNRMHECFKTTRDQVIELMTTSEQPKGVDGNHEYSKEDINSFVDFIKTQEDAFNCSQQDFFFNYLNSKHLSVDKRLLLVRNIKQEISKEEVRQFFGKFGQIVRLTLQASDCQQKTKGAFIHYQTENDSRSTMRDVFDKVHMSDVCKIFYERRIEISTLVPASIRDEVRQQYSSEDAKLKPSQQNKLMPNWQQPGLNLMQIPQQRGPGIPFNPMNQQPPFPMNPIQMNQINQMQPRYNNINRVQNQNRQQRQYYQGVPRQYPQQFQQQNPRAQQQQIRNPNMNMDQKMNMYPPMDLGQNININPNMPMNPNIYQNQLPPQMIPQNIVVTQFRTYNDIVNNMDRFIAQTQTTQRNQLSVLLLPKVEAYLSELNQQVDWTLRVTGMLVDEEQFEIQEILSLFDQPEELESRVVEAVELIKEEIEEQLGQ